jgi:hypothetical protein
MAASRPFPRPCGPAAALVAALVLTASGCGGGDSLPAGGADPPPPGGVRVSAVTPAGRDGDTWYTREALVSVEGDAPAGTMVEALRADGSLAASDRTDDTGRFRIDALPLDGDRPTFDLQARAPGRAPGPVTPLVLVRRLTPPEPFAVDPTPAATNALTVAVSGTAETGAVVVVRVEGGAAPVDARKAAGEARFAANVPLDRDRTHTLTMTAADLAGNRTGPVRRTVVQDSTAPPPPTVASRFVSAPRATLRGQATGAVSVRIDTPADGRLQTAVAPDGGFAVEAALPEEGENRFVAVSTDAAGNSSTPATLVVVRDTTAPGAPEASVEGGDVGGDLVVVPSRSVTLVGRAESGATVEASGPNLFNLTTAGADGAFRVGVVLPWALTPVSIDVEAVDAAGNRSAATSLLVMALGGGGGEGGAR